MGMLDESFEKDTYKKKGQRSVGLESWRALDLPDGRTLKRKIPSVCPKLSPTSPNIPKKYLHI